MTWARRVAAGPPTGRCGVADVLDWTMEFGAGVSGLLAAECITLGLLLGFAACTQHYSDGRLTFVLGVLVECGIVLAFRILWIAPLHRVRHLVARRHAFRALADSVDAPAYKRATARDAVFAQVRMRWTICAVLANTALAGWMADSNYGRALAALLPELGQLFRMR